MNVFTIRFNAVLINWKSRGKWSWKWKTFTAEMVVMVARTYDAINLLWAFTQWNGLIGRNFLSANFFLCDFIRLFDISIKASNTEWKGVATICSTIGVCPRENDPVIIFCHPLEKSRTRKHGTSLRHANMCRLVGNAMFYGASIPCHTMPCNDNN